MRLCALVALIPALAGAPAIGTAGEVPCAPFDRLALERLPTRIDPDSADRLQGVWNQWSNNGDASGWPLTASDDPQFRIQTEEALVPHPRAYEVRGVRTRGVWRLEARWKPVRRLTDKWRPWRQITVLASTAAALNSSVEDRCLWSAPPFLAPTLPLKAGGWVPSYDGPLTYFDVRASGRKWAGLQISWTLGAPAGLRQIALEASFDRPFGEMLPDDAALPSTGAVAMSAASNARAGAADRIRRPMGS